MSSIYRKGRDGLFYYQTYIYNPETKKKDKRIFHSLGTRNRNLAEEKKVKLDTKYEKYQHKNYIKNKIYVFRKYFVLVPLFALSYMLIMSLIKNSKPSEIISNNEKSYKDSVNVDSISNVAQYQIEDDEDQQEVEILVDEKDYNKKIIIPSYELIKTELLSDVFNQIKIFVKIKKYDGKESLYLLCQKIKDEYSSYDHIDIFIFKEISGNKDLVENLSKIIDQNKLAQNWIVMYSYNQVEGEVFNDSPLAFKG